jgi:hypothetical protein
VIFMRDGVLAGGLVIELWLSFARLTATSTAAPTPAPAAAAGFARLAFTR